MEYINLGTFPNDSTADSLTVAVEKMNNNFKHIGSQLKISPPLKKIVWASWGDSKQAGLDINANFQKIEDVLFR